jgi:hypothetical protein
MNRGYTASDENMRRQQYDDAILSDRRSRSTWCSEPELKPDRENQFGTTNCCCFCEHA